MRQAGHAFLEFIDEVTCILGRVSALPRQYAETLQLRALSSDARELGCVLNMAGPAAKIRALCLL